MINPWAVLGVHRQSSEQEIQLAFHLIAKKRHPDISLKPKDLEDFNKANDAYQVLKDKKKTSDFIQQMLLLNKECMTCKGAGATFKSIGIHERVFRGCKACGGAGVLMKEKPEIKPIKGGVR